MAKDNTKAKKGFTIIEVVLVLAIAGLIFLMVFVALPALQRSQRDTQRRDDMARFISQLAQYQANNGGDLPKRVGNTSYTQAYQNFVDAYLKAGDDSFTDPSGEEYVVVYCKESNDQGCNKTSTSALGWPENKFKIYVYHSAKCNGELVEAIEPEAARRIAIRYKLEGAGVYCGNN
jgi:prepilin-type N-terminal cleavage/methylation domain-containing protein